MNERIKAIEEAAKQVAEIIGDYGFGWELGREDIALVAKLKEALALPAAPVEQDLLASLTAERDELKAENKRLRAEKSDLEDRRLRAEMGREGFRIQFEEATAENERLRNCIDRYQLAIDAQGGDATPEEVAEAATRLYNMSLAHAKENERLNKALNALRIHSHEPTCYVRTTRDGFDADCNCLKAENDRLKTEKAELLRVARGLNGIVDNNERTVSDEDS